MSNEQRNDSPVNAGRRRLLGGAAALAGLTIAPGVFLVHASVPTRPEGTPASDQVRWGMLVDTNRCRVDCDACVTACREENGWEGHDRPETDAKWIRKMTVTERDGRQTSLPMMCQHCAEPPCAYVCPTGATFRRDDGIVLVDKHLCIGCRYCMMACPYQVRFFVHEPVASRSPNHPRGKGTVEGCNLCVHRIDQGVLPACVEACGERGQGALIFGDLNDPRSRISRAIAEYGAESVRADLELDTGVRYQGLS